MDGYTTTETTKTTEESSEFVEIGADWFGRITDVITAAALVVIALALVF